MSMPYIESCSAKHLFRKPSIKCLSIYGMLCVESKLTGMPCMICGLFRYTAPGGRITRGQGAAG